MRKAYQSPHLMLAGCSRIHCSSGGILQLLTTYVFGGKNFHDDENVLSHIIDTLKKKGKLVIAFCGGRVGMGMLTFNVNSA